MSEYRTWEELTEAEQLLSHWSDFYKEVNGFRPRFGTSEQVASVEWLNEQIGKLERYLERTKETVAGRNMLRDDGWVIDGAEEDNWEPTTESGSTTPEYDSFTYVGAQYEYLEM